MQAGGGQGFTLAKTQVLTGAYLGLPTRCLACLDTGIAGARIPAATGPGRREGRAKEMLERYSISRLAIAARLRPAIAIHSATPSASGRAPTERIELRVKLAPMRKSVSTNACLEMPATS